MDAELGRFVRSKITAEFLQAQTLMALFFSSSWSYSVSSSPDAVAQAVPACMNCSADHVVMANRVTCPATLAERDSVGSLLSHYFSQCTHSLYHLSSTDESTTRHIVHYNFTILSTNK